jgi:hypothetical protein
MVGGIHHHLSEGAQRLTDVVAGIVAIGAIAKILPSIAALFTIIWLGIRIWESDTVRAFTGRAITGKRDED